MWTEFLVAIILAAGLLAPELRRLATKYGFLLATVAGGCAVVTVAVWLLVLFVIGSNLANASSAFGLWQLLVVFVLPLSTFLYVHRRFSVTPSLLPTGLVFVAVSFVFLMIGLHLNYSS